MIFNCLSCGKSISTVLDVCPYCKLVLGEVVELLEGREKRALSPKDHFKGTILGALWKGSDAKVSRFAFRR